MPRLPYNGNLCCILLSGCQALIHMKHLPLPTVQPSYCALPSSLTARQQRQLSALRTCAHFSVRQQPHDSFLQSTVIVVYCASCILWGSNVHCFAHPSPIGDSCPLQAVRVEHSYASFAPFCAQLACIIATYCGAFLTIHGYFPVGCCFCSADIKQTWLHTPVLTPRQSVPSFT